MSAPSPISRPSNAPSPTAGVSQQAPAAAATGTAASAALAAYPVLVHVSALERYAAALYPILVHVSALERISAIEQRLFRDLHRPLKNPDGNPHSADPDNYAVFNQMAIIPEPSPAQNSPGTHPISTSIDVQSVVAFLAEIKATIAALGGSAIEPAAASSSSSSSSAIDLFVAQSSAAAPAAIPQTAATASPLPSTDLSSSAAAALAELSQKKRLERAQKKRLERAVTNARIIAALRSDMPLPLISDNSLANGLFAAVDNGQELVVKDFMGNSKIPLLIFNKCTSTFCHVLRMAAEGSVRPSETRYDDEEPVFVPVFKRILSALEGGVPRALLAAFKELFVKAACNGDIGIINRLISIYLPIYQDRKYREALVLDAEEKGVRLEDEDDDSLPVDAEESYDLLGTRRATAESLCKILATARKSQKGLIQAITTNGMFRSAPPEYFGELFSQGLVVAAENDQENILNLLVNNEPVCEEIRHYSSPQTCNQVLAAAVRHNHTTSIRSLTSSLTYTIGSLATTLAIAVEKANKDTIQVLISHIEHRLDDLKWNATFNESDSYGDWSHYERALAIFDQALRGKKLGCTIVGLLTIYFPEFRLPSEVRYN